MLEEIISLVGPGVVGVLSMFIMQVLRIVVTALDRAPAFVKQLAVVAISFGLTQLGLWVDMTIPLDLSLFTTSDVQAIVSALLAFHIHDGFKSDLNRPRGLS